MITNTERLRILRSSYANRTPEQKEHDKAMSRDRYRRTHPDAAPYRTREEIAATASAKRIAKRDAPWPKEHTTYKGITTYSD